MARKDGDTSPDRLLHRIVSPLQQMRVRVSHLKSCLDYLTRSIISARLWHYDASEAKEFLEGLTVLIRELHRECAKLTPYDKKVSVLIVDEYKENRFLYRTLLSKFDMEVHEVLSGEAAIQTHKAHGGKTKYHLIIMNHDLPGICGTTTTAILRQDLHVESIMVGVIVLDNGYETPDTPRAIDFKDAGLDYCLKKHHFSDRYLLTVLGMFAQKEVSFHVGNEVDKVLRRIDDLELTLGLEHDPSDD